MKPILAFKQIADQSGFNRGVPKATPENDLADYLAYLFEKHSTLETPPLPCPKQSHLSSKVKDRS